jgi:hypothetical protein
MDKDEAKPPEEAAGEGRSRRMSRRSVIGAGGAAAAGVAGAALAGSVAGAATTPGTNKLPVPVKTVSEYIAVASVIATQIESNPKFAALMQADPQGELTKLGIGEDAVRELLTGEVGFAAAGTAYNCSLTCVLTCLTTGSCCCTNCVPGLAFGAPVSGYEVSEGRAVLAQSLVAEGHLKLPGIPKNKGG